MAIVFFILLCIGIVGGLLWTIQKMTIEGKWSYFIYFLAAFLPIYITSLSVIFLATRSPEILSLFQILKELIILLAVGLLLAGLFSWGQLRQELLPDIELPFVTVGAAGGKRLAHAMEVADLAVVTHDPLLAQLRYQLRKHHGGARNGSMGVSGVFSREAVSPPDASCALTDAADGSLNCHGYGSAVSVTASFGMAAAGALMNTIASVSKSTASLENSLKITL